MVSKVWAMVIHRMMIEALAAVVAFSVPLVSFSLRQLVLVSFYQRQLSSPWLSGPRASCTSCRQKAGSHKDRKDQMGLPLEECSGEALESGAEVAIEVSAGEEEPEAWVVARAELVWEPVIVGEPKAL